jgi:hypothetical protein
MNANKLKWARQTNLENLFTLQWTYAMKGPITKNLQTWEELEDGRIQG